MEQQTRMYIMKKKTKPIIYVLQVIILIALIGMGYLALQYKEKVDKKADKIKVERPMSNVSFEMEQVKNMIGEKGILEIKMSGEDIVMILKKDVSLEALTARYEDNMEVEYLSDKNVIKIHKQVIKEDTTKKDQLIDYITTKTPTISIEEELKAKR